MYKEVKEILKKYSKENNIFLTTKVTACVLGTLIVIDEYEDEEYQKSVMERLYISKGEMIKRLIKSQQITGLNFFLDQEVMDIIGKMDSEDYKKLLSFYDSEEKYGLNLFNKIIALNYGEDQKEENIEVDKLEFFHKIFDMKDDDTYNDPFMDKGLLSLYPAYAEDEDFNFVGCETNEEYRKLYKLKDYFLISSDEEYMSIYLKDSITNPLEKKNGELRRFDYIITIPPVKSNYSIESLREDKFQRFNYTKLGNFKSLDWIYLDHVISTLTDKGRAMVFLPEHLLSDGGENKSIREALVKSDIIEKIIILPENALKKDDKQMCCFIINKMKNEKGIIDFIDLKSLEKMQDYDYEYYGLKLISDEVIEKGLDKLHKKYTRENLKEKEYNLNVFYPCK